MRDLETGEAENISQFVLAPSSIHGVGVFAVKAFKAGEYLPLFSEECVILDNLPSPPFDKYCVELTDGRVMAPPDFTRMSVGWYLNHSKTPNAKHRSYQWFAVADIQPGEEITIDYDGMGSVPEAEAVS